eukprot:m.444917 g.444917  ORF g.444917 m.444917 type:complete len:304 (-) comp19164_c0_seq1:192-1103(-)
MAAAGIADEGVPPGYTEGPGAKIEMTVDNVCFADEWVGRECPEGFKFRVTLAADGGLTVWAENKGNRHQFKTVKTAKECAALIANPAIPTEQFVDMLSCALEDPKTEGELAVGLLRGCDGEEGVTISLVFAPSRFMTQKFTVGLPSQEVDQVGLLEAQMQDIWSWKREMARTIVAVGKWMSVTDCGNGAFVKWDRQALVTPESFDQEPDNTTVRILKPGLYKVEAQITVTTSANQYMALYVNNAQVATAYASSQGNYISTYHIADLVNADAGTTVKVQVRFSASMNVGEGSNRLLITRMGDKL